MSRQFIERSDVEGAGAGSAAGVARRTRVTWRAVVRAAALALGFLGGMHVVAGEAAEAGWGHYGGDAGGQRYVAAKEITPANVSGLTEACRLARWRASLPIR